MDPTKIKIGLNTHPGHDNESNEDRVLVGMDPAANDWLYSPDEITAGEFGSVIMLANGIGKDRNGGKAASLVCNTVKRLFNETLELPPEPQDILKLMVRFFKIANQQLMVKSRELVDLKGFACTATLILIKDSVLYTSWVGDCRLYRYAAKGVEGSLFLDHPHLEQLNIDHDSRTERLPDGLKKTLIDEEVSRSRYFGQDSQNFTPGIATFRLRKSDKILLCTEGCYDFLDGGDMANVLGEDIAPDLIAEKLVSTAFNNQAHKNITAIVVEILNGMIASPKQRLDVDQLMAKAVALLSPEGIVHQGAGGNPKSQNDAEGDLKPLKLRTVLPDDDQDDTPPSTDQEDAQENDTKESAVDDENPAMNRPVQSPVFPRETHQNQNEPTEPSDRPKPRVMATAYPDPDPDHDQPLSEENDKDEASNEPMTPNTPDEKSDISTPQDLDETEEDAGDESEEEVPIADTEEETSINSDEEHEEPAVIEEIDREDPREKEDPTEEEPEKVNQIPPIREKQTGEPTKRRPLPSVNMVRIGLILVAILLLTVLICKNRTDKTPVDPLLETVDDPPKTQDKASPKVPKETKEIPKDDPKTDQPATKSKPETKEAEKTKEEDKKDIPRTEPDYDDKIKANKDKLKADIEALLVRKSETCQSVNTYKNNAPSAKVPKIEPLLYDCDQLTKKFASIYDTRTGYFNTVRYDLLTSTIENIRFSLDQLDTKFERVRRAE